MGKEQDYRLTAAGMVDRAHKATTAIDKRRLSQLAEKRLDLAERRRARWPRNRSGRSAIIRWSRGRSETARPRRNRLGGMAEPAPRRASRPAFFHATSSQLGERPLTPRPIRLIPAGGGPRIPTFAAEDEGRRRAGSP